MCLAAASVPAIAQEGNTVSVGPPQLRDFQLPGERRTPPPRPQQIDPQPAQSQRAPAPATKGPARPRIEEPRARAAADTRPRSSQSEPGRTLPSQPQEVFQLPQAPAESAAPLPAPLPEAQPGPTAAPAPADDWPLWYYLLPAALLALGGARLLRRRRRAAATALAGEDATAAIAAPPRPAPVPRPWIEIELKAERAASTDSEAWVEFELVLHNTGKSPARNIRVNARMVNAGREQDKEIGVFFRTKGEGRKTHTIGDLPPDERGLVQGSVSMPREEMRALQVNEQLLFIPVLAVNVLYDWGEGRTGQTSKSYVVGRELGEQSQKMGAFRLDLGPRIYRTVGQRQHSLAKRV